MFVGDNDQNGGVTNPSCGGEDSINPGAKKSFYLINFKGCYLNIRSDAQSHSE